MLNKLLHKRSIIVMLIMLLTGCTEAPTPTVTPTSDITPSQLSSPGITILPSPTGSNPQTTMTNSPVVTQPGTETVVSGQQPIKTVWIIMMENHNWADIKNSTSAPYINQTLLRQGAHAEEYYNPPGIHPSEPNYLWLEAGTNFSISDDSGPLVHHQATTAHLTTLLNNAGISWKAYEEDISGTICPLNGTGLYAPKHNPMIFFDDVTGKNNGDAPYCIAHERPYTELSRDLTNNTVSRYNFITPNICNDMHDACTGNAIAQGDKWLAQQVPLILNSVAYQKGGALFITWDEGEGNVDGPIGMIVMSAAAKSGYQNNIHYTHGSTLRTVQEIFGVTPFLGDAAQQNDLSDLFTTFP